MFKTYIIIAVVGSMVVTVGLLYYRDTQKRISALQQNNAKLEVAIQSKETALNEMTANFEKQSRLNKELSGKLEDAEKDQDDLRSKLQKHDLTRLSIGKHGMMEKRINDDTKKLFSDFESITAK